jgi:hypothetical protein
VVGYLASNPNAQYIQTGYGALANVGRSTLQLDPINDVDLSALKRINITSVSRWSSALRRPTCSTTANMSADS